ncbi:hypothetical protein ACSS6W_006679 [Trichoderma asperelloides]
MNRLVRLLDSRLPPLASPRQQRWLAGIWLSASSSRLVFRATGPFFSSQPEPISTLARLHVQRRDALSQSPPGATLRSEQAARA